MCERAPTCFTSLLPMLQELRSRETDHCVKRDDFRDYVEASAKVECAQQHTSYPHYHAPSLTTNELCVCVFLCCCSTSISLMPSSSKACHQSHEHTHTYTQIDSSTCHKHKPNVLNTTSRIWMQSSHYISHFARYKHQNK